MGKTSTFLLEPEICSVLTVSESQLWLIQQMNTLKTVPVFLMHPFLSGHTRGVGKVPDQGWNSSQSCDPSCCCQVFNPWNHSRNALMHLWRCADFNLETSFVVINEQVTNIQSQLSLDGVKPCVVGVWQFLCFLCLEMRRWLDQEQAVSLSSRDQEREKGYSLWFFKKPLSVFLEGRVCFKDSESGLGRAVEEGGGGNRGRKRF